MGSCSKEHEPAAPVLEWTTDIATEAPLFVVPETTVTIGYAAQHVQAITTDALPDGWNVRVDEEAQAIVISATADAETRATLTVTAVGEGDRTVSQSVALYCLNAFDDPNGTFVLNEGNMTTENGSLTYISPEGYVWADAYRTVNGTELGNVAQDMAFCDGKIYVISQNGNENAVGATFENDGMLVVMDARTLKKTAAYTNQDLAQLDWPTHIAVLDEQHIYIRDNAGIYRFDATTRQLTFARDPKRPPKADS
ncbi:MAG TPA: hypothetical protein H9816_08520 [Candidatus Tidjanibacter faecipullorum]|uniref:BIG2 domain-containing protein n=1 Tax=Candidatus Tidjanibacter faecipullorum TaxID=2838766 RepID=A0A9D2IM49_9BACT|nr:hypothetical protein [Candidatus Tidjanibacter faecipullorum]